MHLWLTCLVCAGVHAQDCAVVTVNELGGSTVDVAICGSLLFETSSLHGLRVVDVSDPTSPALLSMVPDIGVANDVEVEGDTAFVVSDLGLKLFDIGDPTSPQLLATVDGIVEPFLVEVQDGIAYVRDEVGLRVVDASDPAHAEIVGTLEIFISRMNIDGNTLWGKVGQTLHAIDVTDPGNPHQVGSVFVDSFSGIDASDGFVYLYESDFDIHQDTQFNTLTIVEADPVNPQVVNSFITNVCSGLGGEDLVVVDQVAYVGGCEVQAFDVSNPNAPVLLGAVETPGLARRFDASEDLLVVGDDFFGTQIIDRTEPTLPIIGSHKTPVTTPWGVHLHEGLAYVPARTAGLEVFDVSRPTTPVRIGDVDTPASARSIVIVDDVAYVAERRPIGGERGGLQIIDVSDPTSPQLISSIVPGSSASVVEVHGDLAYLGDDFGLFVIDVSDPENPLEIGSSPVGGSFFDLVVDGHIAYGALGAEGMRVFDVSDPTAPTEIVTLTPGFTAGVALQGTLLYAVDQSWRFKAIDVSDPAMPTVVDDIVLTDIAPFGNLLIVGDRAFVGGQTTFESIGVIDISDPTQLALLATANLPGSHWGDLALNDGLLYATESDRINVFDVSSCLQCAADVNADGVLNILDFIAFQQFWNEQDAVADCDANGVFDILDFVCFQQLFQNGC